MTQPSGFTADLRISPRPASLALFLIAVVIFVLSYQPSALIAKIEVAALSASLVFIARLAWWLDNQQSPNEPVGSLRAWLPQLSRWILLLTCAALFPLSAIWIGWPAALLFAVLPVALAAVLVGLKASLLFAFAESVLIGAIFVRYQAISALMSVSAVISIWALWLLLLAAYRPMLDTSQWAQEYIHSARILLDDARARKAELESALKDLADANQQLARLNQLAHGLRQAADDARAAKEQFVANVSHELRTPLNMIIGFTEMILHSPQTYGKKIPGALLADLTVIKRNAEHLSHLIDDVLDLSQIDTDQMALTRENLPFQEIIEFSLAAVMPLYRLKGLYLKREGDEELPVIFCDRTRIREVMLNLLSNAGRFTEKGGVVVCARRVGDVLEVAVRDTGPGIAPEDQDKLFHPFEQLDASIRRRYGGTGLGLAISKRFIELHHGKIWVDSQIGVGTTFSFQIPLNTPPPLASGLPRGINPYLPIEQRAHLPHLPKKSAPPRYLVFEQGSVLQHLLRRYLGEIDIEPVSSLAEARQRLANHPARALLINGVSINETLESLKGQVDHLKGIPIITCSLPEAAGQASAAMGVADILVKPITRQSLLESLEKLQVDSGSVLIVDDEPDVLQLFSRILASAGKNYRVLQAQDGVEALHILEECCPDVILLDLVMPNLNGFQLLELCKQKPELQNIPIIIISARNPSGQPIASQGLAVTQTEGLSARQLLACIQAISQFLSVGGQPADPDTPTIPPG